MLRKVEKCRQSGANGIVFGILDENGFINMERNAQLAEMAGEMKKTFHMAFDFARDVDIMELIYGAGRRKNSLVNYKRIVFVIMV